MYPVVQTTKAIYPFTASNKKKKSSVNYCFFIKLHVITTKTRPKTVSNSKLNCM